jgi:hypothetical protein
VTSVETVNTLARVLPKNLDDAMQLLDEPALEKLALYGPGVHNLVANVRQLLGPDLQRPRPLDTDAEEARAAELLSQGVLAIKDLEMTRKRFTEPLNDQLKAVRSVFSALTDPAESVCGKQGPLERALIAYRRLKETRRQRAEDEARRWQEEAARAEAEARMKAEAAATEKERAEALDQAEAAQQEQTAAELQAPLPMPKGIRTDSGSVTTRKRWVLLGIHDLDKVPQVYWRDPAVIEVLKKVLQRAITAGAREIPGCSIDEEEGLTRRPGL